MDWENLQTNLRTSSFTKFPPLANGTPADLANLQISGAGCGVHWPDLDEDIGVEVLLVGKHSSQSASSCKRWLHVRVALILATIVTPFRFRTKRQLWTYVGLAVVTKTSAEYEFFGGRLHKRNKPTSTRGLNRNFNRRLKKVFKSAALDATRTEPFASYYRDLIEKGTYVFAIVFLPPRMFIPQCNLSILD